MIRTRAASSDLNVESSSSILTTFRRELSPWFIIYLILGELYAGAKTEVTSHKCRSLERQLECGADIRRAAGLSGPVQRSVHVQDQVTDASGNRPVAIVTAEAIQHSLDPLA
jgi:hypothetical protein